MVQFHGESLRNTKYLREDDSLCPTSMLRSGLLLKHFAILKVNTVGKGLPTNHKINSEKSSVEP